MAGLSQFQGLVTGSRNILPIVQLGVSGLGRRHASLQLRSLLGRGRDVSQPIQVELQETGVLATPGTWSHNTWEMSFHLGVHVNIQKQFQIRPVREGTSALARLFSFWVTFKQKHVLDTLKAVRRFKNMLHLPNLLCWEGCILDWVCVLSREQEASTRHHLQKEKARTKSCVLWERVVCPLTGGRDLWSTQLCPFLQRPPIPIQLFHRYYAIGCFTADGRSIYGEVYNEFTLQAIVRPPCSGQRYKWTCTWVGGTPT